MLIRNFLPSYRASIAIVAAIVVIGAVMILFSSDNANQRKSKEAIKEIVEDAKNIALATISEETKRSLSERPPGTEDAVISEETKRSLSARLPGAVDVVITPEVAQSLSARPSD